MYNLRCGNHFIGNLRLDLLSMSISQRSSNTACDFWICRKGERNSLDNQRHFIGGAAQTLSHISLGCKTAGGTAPQPSTRDRSLPVPIGRMQTSGKGLICRLKISVKIHPTVPSPPATKIRHWILSIFLIRLSASSGPAELSSNIWIGFRTLRQMAITSAAALSPDLRFATKVGTFRLHSFRCPPNFQIDKILTNNNQWLPSRTFRRNNGWNFCCSTVFQKYIVGRYDEVFVCAEITYLEIDDKMVVTIAYFTCIGPWQAKASRLKWNSTPNHPVQFDYN